MKRIFGNPQLSKETLQLQTFEQTLKTRTPYAVMQIATTCDETKAQQNFCYPIRVTVKEFAYNWKTDRYEDTIAFDKMIKCPDESLKYATDRLHYNNIFVRNGMDKDAYMRGENVLDVDTFKTEFDRFMSAISENPNEPLILSNDNYTISKYATLEKINCADKLQEMHKNHRLLSITDLTKAHFNEKSLSNGGRGINYTITLDSLKQYLEKHGVIALENNNKPLPEARIKTVCDFATYFGRYVHTFGSKEQAEETLKIHKEIESKIEGGKLKYRDSSLEEKLRTFIEMGQLTPEMLQRDTECDLNKMLDIFEGKGANGIVIMQAATTGTGTRATPIQFTAMALSVNEGNFKPESYISFNIECASKNNLEYALQNEKYDSFAKAGINREDYLNGKGVKGFAEATKVIDNFMKKYDDYTIVSCGKYFNNKRDTKTSDISFTQGAMKSICNFPWTSRPSIDFQNVEKQYAYRAHFSDRYDKNALFDESKWGNSTFRLEDLAAYHERNIIGTRAKCEFMCDMLSIIAEQDILVAKGELHAERIQPLDIDGAKIINKDIADELRATLPAETSPIVVIENLKEDMAKEPDDIPLIELSESIKSAFESPIENADNLKKTEPASKPPEKDDDGSFIEDDADFPADVISDKDVIYDGYKTNDEAAKEAEEKAAVNAQPAPDKPPLSAAGYGPNTESRIISSDIDKQNKIDRLKRLAGGVKIGNKTLTQSDEIDKSKIKEENGFAYIEKSEDDMLKDMVKSVITKKDTTNRYDKPTVDKILSEAGFTDAIKSVLESNKNKQIKMANAGLTPKTFEDILDADILHVVRNIDGGKQPLDGIIIEPKPDKPMEMLVEPTPVPQKQQEAEQPPKQAVAEAPAAVREEPKPEPVRVTTPAYDRPVERPAPAAGLDADTTRMLANILAATNKQTDAIRGQTEAIREQANAEKELLKLQINQSQANIEALIAQNQSMTAVLRETVVQFSRAYTIVNEMAMGRSLSEETNELLADVNEAMQNISRQLEGQKGIER